MRLYVTVVAAPGLSWDDDERQGQRQAHLLAQLPNGPVELVLEVEAGPGSAIVTQLDLEAPAPTRFWVEGMDLGKLQAGEPPLVDGVVIVASPQGGSVPVRRRRFNHDLVFSVLSGPDSGELKVLRRGRYSIGRVDHSINIADPLLSRHHAQLTVEAASVRLKDCGSANGTFVDQTRITTASVTTESIMQLGSSRCSLRFSDESKPLPQSHPDPAEPLVISRDAPPQRRGTMMLTALLPVVIGVGLALITGMWIFLAFSAVSAVTMLLPVFSGRGRRAKFRRDLEAARIADRDRRLAATPFLADTIQQTIEGAAAVPRTRRTTMPAVKDVDQSVTMSRWIRLGTAAQSANLRLDPPDKGFVPPVLPAMPVALNLSTVGQLAIAGAADQMTSLIRSLSMQISQSTGHYQRLMFCGPLPALPLSARFLPGVQLIPTVAEAVSALLDEEGIPPVLFIDQRCGITSKEEATVRQMVITGRLNVIWYGDSVFREDIPTLALSRESAVYRAGHEVLELIPDMVSERNFDRYCRARARLLASNPATRASIPKMPIRAPLDGIADASVLGIRNSWRRTNEDAAHLQAPIGVTPSQPMSIDLQQDGPHLLIAGTTGSGKSELLRTLVISLAVTHSPSKMNFLFVDFKGGSGLGPLRSLPHTVGMLTDLSTEAVGRAMESLRAEARRRELLFAQAEAPDLASYRKLRTKGMEELTHLVLVIDEYRMLLEEVPDAMDELLRIATLGRSLGLHLVMATQRPQGAVSADIRANVTTSIALRVQSAMESQDVIDSSVAAGISVKVPGRAYLKRGGESPEPFQSASTSEKTPRISGPATITTLERYLEAGTLHEKTPPACDSRPDALISYISAVSAAWNDIGSPPVRTPIANPLPERLDEMAPELGGGAYDPEGTHADQEPIPLGLLDLPSVQQQKRLIWEPKEDSHLALLGAPRSGLNSSLRHIVGQLLRRDVRQTHLYILDGDGTLPGLNRDSHVGAYVGADETRRAVRVIELLAEALSDRLASDFVPSGPEMSGGETGQHNLHKEPVLLVLVISSWGRWVSAIRGSPWPWAEDYLHDLARDGGKARVALIIGGDRELATARFLGVIPNRIYLPTGASSESLMSWPKLPRLKKLPGRAFVQGRFVPVSGISQLVPCSTSSWHEIDFHTATGIHQEHLPFRVAALPRQVVPAEVSSAVTEDDEVLLGVRGDDLHPITLRMAAAEVLLILGPPKSGKSMALEMVAAMGSDNRRWIAVSSAALDPASPQDLMTKLEALETDPATTTLLLDNADRLSQQAHQSLTNLHNRGYGVIMTATTGPAVMTRIPLAMPARSTGKGVVLAPRSAMDGDFFGVRIDPDPRFVPGRAVIIEGGTCVPAQLFLPSKSDQ